MKTYVSLALSLLAAAVSVHIEGAAQQLSYVYRNGEEGYQCFRIPTIVATKAGTLLAFAEGRKDNCGDAGNVDLVVKRSTNGGGSWSALHVVRDDSGNTCGNPVPVIDRASGKVILLSTWNVGTDHEPQIIAQTGQDTRRVFVSYSSDDGITWTAAREITRDVKRPEWTWYATGPANGIQLRQGAFKGRLVVPCDHIEAVTKKYFSHIIYSDDSGSTWKLGGSTPADQVNECTVAELSTGDLMLNMRNAGPVRVRQTSVSTDGGSHWSELCQDTALIEPVCQASLIRCEPNGTKPFLAFSNPASQDSRVNMTVRISYDDGKTWPVKTVLYTGPSAYSNLVLLSNGRPACLFEAGERSPYEGIVFKEVPGDAEGQ